MEEESKLVKGQFPELMAFFWKNERYLEEQAKKGLFLKKWDGYWLLFAQDAPMDMRYRIEPGKEALDKETLETYNKSGWDYVVWFEDYHIFSAPLDREVVEIHTDPVERSFVLEKSIKKYRGKLLFEAIGIGLFFALLLYFIFAQGTWVYNLTTGTYGTLFFTIPLILFILIETCKRVKNYKKIQTDLQEGVDAPWEEWEEWEEKEKSKGWQRYVFNGIYILIILPMLFGLTKCQKREYEIDDNNSTTVYGEAEFGSTSLPIVFVEDVFETEGYTFSVPNSYFEEDYSIFMSESWKTREEWWRDDVEIRVRNEYYNLHIKEFAPLLAKDLHKLVVDIFFEERTEEHMKAEENSPFDVLYIAKTDRFGSVIYTAAKGSRVLQVTCDKEVEEENLLAAMEKALNAAE